MSTPYGFYSAAFIPRGNDVRKEFHVQSPSKSNLFEDLPLQIDTPFAEIIQYMCDSSPDSSDARLMNLCHSAMIEPPKFFIDNDCGTPNIHHNLNLDSLATTCSFPTKIGVATSCDKGIHKVIERQRRSDMKALYSLLRSLLPEKYLKGKRSTVDQVTGAVNYIQDLHKDIKVLTEKRDEVRMQSNKLISSGPEAIPTVKINFLGSVLQVSTNTLKHQIVYSDLLLALEEEGLEIFSALSSTTDDKVFHTIHAKVMDNFESDTLYQKLWQMVRKNMAIA